ncbi:MAG: iron-sulfur cluster assembly scaffold protein [Pseudomonadota bacterium]
MTTASPTTKLYTPKLLGLSTQLALYPLDDAFEAGAEMRSAVCGSTIEIGLERDEHGAVRRIGMRLSACAIGQASAAIMAGGIAGARRETIEAMVRAVERWLNEDGALPDWPGFADLEAAQDHRGRHGALLLPWNAALQALS